MNRTKIEWVKNPDGTQGYTWNPITGCLNGCPYCYARKLANGRLKWLYHANTNVAIREDKDVIGTKYPVPTTDYSDPFYPRFWPERLDDMTPFNHEKKPKGIFVCDMSDLFGIGIPEEWTRRVFETINDHPEHRFYLLTKQPQNLPQWSPFPDNCWVGGTVPNNNLWRRVIMNLGYYTEAKVKYISFEPLLERICLPPLPFTMINGKRLIDWVIIGAQTKPYRPPKVEWVREIVDACVKAGIPYFLKDNLRKLFIAPDGEIPKLRQEMPSANL